MVPLIGPGFSPTDKDEKGLWQEMERAEEEIAGSNLLIKDPKLTGYLQELIGTVGGPAAKDFRIYLAHIPEFNAMMFPTGFAVVFSGLLLRMRNEAQLAGVIAHEFGPFPAPPHDPLLARPAAQDRHLRDRGDARRRRRRGGRRLSRRLCPACPARHDPVAVPVQPRDGSRSRRDGRQADRRAPAIAPIEMANIWQQLIGEENASARYRRKHRRQRRRCSTPTRRRRLAHGRPSADAAELTVPGRAYDDRPRPLSLDDRRRSARCCSTTRSSSTTRAPANI